MAQSAWSDDELGMNRRITRRDFLDGVALAAGTVAASTVLGGTASAADRTAAADVRPANAPGSGAYPPAATGMRGSHAGSFEVAHALRDGTFWENAGTPTPTDRPYDLVVVGAGISGLSAAHYYLRDVDRKARILVLDPHDDFGGHAKRNEFTVNGRTLIGYGGSQSIDNPSAYPPEAFQVFADLGIDLSKFETTYFDRDFYARHGVRDRATFFAKEAWGRDHLAKGFSAGQILADAPLDAAAKQTLVEILDAPKDYLAGLTHDQKLAVLRQMSYGAFLVEYAGLTGDAYRYLLHSTAGGTGVNIDQFPALDAAASFYPGMTGLELDFDHGPWPGLAKTGVRFWGHQDPYIYHFPDGNASIARALVRRLNPTAIPGSTTEDLVTARCDYGRLDHDASTTRIRLNSTVVRVRNLPGGRAAEVAYVQDGKLFTVRAGGVVMACWNAMVPHIAPELPDAHKAAGHQAVKYPMIYANVALTNWRPWQRLGVSRITFPGGFWGGASLDFPVSMGDYRFSANPDEPILVHFDAMLTKPDMDRQRAAKAGRGALARMTFEEMERSIRDSLARTLGPYGLDPAADIAAITTNRWAHGYARWYSTPFDAFWPQGPTPADVIGTPVGRLTVATTDQAAHGFVDGAMESAYRAVQYLGSLR
ncbi:NAD(P)-binding protein [Streptomyces sp. NPDC051020]|uniref:NAD(P)-binding protein n=1 Tax=Streptomyces sp. NPDC051020 TaxID=3155409 RepID=UPI0034472790